MNTRKYMIQANAHLAYSIHSMILMIAIKYGANNVRIFGSIAQTKPIPKEIIVYWLNEEK